MYIKQLQIIFSCQSSYILPWLHTLPLALALNYLSYTITCNLSTLTVSRDVCSITGPWQIVTMCASYNSSKISKQAWHKLHLLHYTILYISPFQLPHSQLSAFDDFK